MAHARETSFSTTNLTHRLQTGVFLAICLLIISISSTAWPFSLLMLVAQLLREWLNFLPNDLRLRAILWLMILLPSWFILGSYFSFVEFYQLFSLAIIVGVFAQICGYTAYPHWAFWRDYRFQLANVLLGVGLLAFFLLVACRLHQTQYELMLSLSFLVCLADCGGYFCGRVGGSRKLFPQLSPNKTLYGTLAGCLLPTIAGYILSHWQPLPWRLIVTIGPVSLLGDLYISLLKRTAGKKDTGDILPGHGGLLDRLDSGLLAACWTYLLL